VRTDTCAREGSALPCAALLKTAPLRPQVSVLEARLQEQRTQATAELVQVGS
jgi:hypothetical protein